MWIKDRTNVAPAGSTLQADAGSAMMAAGSELATETGLHRQYGLLRLGNTWLSQSICAESRAQYITSDNACSEDGCYTLVFPAEEVRIRTAKSNTCYQSGEPFLFLENGEAVLSGRIAMAIRFPAADLLRKVPALPRRCPLALNATSPVVQMLWRYCSSSLALGKNIGERQGQLFSEQIGSLLSLELSTTLKGPDTSTTDMAAVHRGRIFELINVEFANAEFTLSRLCERLHLSRRYVQRILARHGTSFSDYLRTVRLEAAAVQLSHAQPPLKLAQLAEECGFRSQSSFNRVFKRHFGQTPRAYHTNVISEREP